MIIARMKDRLVEFARVTSKYDPRYTYPHHFTWWQDHRNATVFPDTPTMVRSFKSLVSNDKDSSVIYKLLKDNGEEYDVSVSD